MADPWNGGPPEWQTPGMADLRNGGPPEWGGAGTVPAVIHKIHEKRGTEAKLLWPDALPVANQQ